MQRHCADVNSPYKRKCWTNSGGPLTNSLLWGVDMLSTSGSGTRFALVCLFKFAVFLFSFVWFPLVWFEAQSHGDHIRLHWFSQYNGIHQQKYAKYTEFYADSKSVVIIGKKCTQKKLSANQYFLGLSLNSVHGLVCCVFVLVWATHQTGPRWSLF